MVGWTDRYRTLVLTLKIMNSNKRKNDLISKVLAIQAWDPEFYPIQYPHNTKAKSSGTCRNPTTEDAEKERVHWSVLINQSINQSSQMSELQVLGETLRFWINYYVKYNNTAINHTLFLKVPKNNVKSDWKRHTMSIHDLHIHERVYAHKTV